MNFSTISLFAVMSIILSSFSGNGKYHLYIMHYYI